MELPTIYQCTMSNTTIKLISPAILSIPQIENMKVEDSMNEDFVKRQLLWLWGQYLLQPNHGLQIDPWKVQYDSKFGEWHLHDSPLPNLFEPGFTIPDMILFINGTLTVVEVKSCWINHIPGRYSYCVDTGTPLYVGEESDGNSTARYSKISSLELNALSYRGITQAVNNQRKLTTATSLPVKILVVIGVFDFKTRCLNHVMYFNQ